ncbi:MAG: hypothetical protein IKH33_08790 [Bacteroidales bacterium]|nr:hypothetical protein [Bacteroidales bacterium]
MIFYIPRRCSDTPLKRGRLTRSLASFFCLILHTPSLSRHPSEEGTTADAAA